MYAQLLYILNNKWKLRHPSAAVPQVIKLIQALNVFILDDWGHLVDDIVIFQILNFHSKIIIFCINFKSNDSEID